MNNVRHGRKTLFRSPQTSGGSPTTINSGTDFGTFQVGGFSRFTGMVQAVGSLTLTWKMGVHSGRYLVTSSVLISSGNNIFDQVNFGIYTEFGFTAANSQTADFLVMGEPIR